MVGTVTITEMDCVDGVHRIGVATLDNTPSLNALTFDMLLQLHDQLIKWQHDPHVVCVVLSGAGEKAFCAGGDVRAMYHVMHNESKEATVEFCTKYFALEYECDYLIHTYNKPIIGWGGRHRDGWWHGAIYGYKPQGCYANIAFSHARNQHRSISRRRWYLVP